MAEARRMSSHSGDPIIRQPSPWTHPQSSSTYPDAGLIDFAALEEATLQANPITGSNIYHAPTHSSSQRPNSRRPSEDVGLIGLGGPRGEAFRSNNISQSEAAPTLAEVHAEAEVPAPINTAKRVTRSSKKRTRVDADLVSTDVEDSLEDKTAGSRRSTRRCKSVKTSSRYNNAGNESEDGVKKIRKVSKLNAKIAEGKGPKRGSLGPNGEVRTREDGRMEFRDLDNPEWSM